MDSGVKAKPVLVTGGTGYVGGRLIPLLLQRGYRVRAMARHPEKLACRPWGRHPALELTTGDALNAEGFRLAAQGCGAAFYLIHSMIAHSGAYAEADRRAARHMAQAAAAGGLERIVYLGGLGASGQAPLSRHLRSRHEVECILKAGPIPLTSLRAAMILGAGSASFEMLRYLVERLPMMIAPRWIRTPCQPIAIRDVLGYLVGCLEDPRTVGETFDIGGPEVTSYLDLIRIYAQEAGLPSRLVLTVPVLTPWLSAKWIHLVTPVPAAIAQPLAEGLSIPVVCRDNRIRALVPLRLSNCRDTIRRALERVRQEQVDTCWADAGRLTYPEWVACGDAAYAGGTIMRTGYRVRTTASPERVWQAVQGIGGARGWYAAPILWRLRGLVDRLCGGPGLSRGRRSPTELRVGDAVDFFRVLTLEPPRYLVLAAEMKAPGEALLEFAVQDAPGGTELTLVSRYLPRGLGGLAYGALLAPAHEWLFRRLTAAVATRAGGRLLGAPRRFQPATHTACRLGPV
jgi:uncharacterized protein YbjT (DUF2867 family)